MFKKKNNYNIEIMQELVHCPTFGCVVPNFYFSPTVLKPITGIKKEKKKVWRL